MRPLRLAPLVATAVALLAACGGDGGPDEDARSAARDAGVLLSEVSDHPEPLYGHSVTISGEVRRRIGARALVLGDPGGDAVLVLAERPLDTGIRPGDAIGASGVVRRLDELDLGARGVDAGELGDDVREGGVVVATRIDRDPPARGPAGGDTESPRPSGAREVRVALGDVVARPARYAGREVTVSGEIERVLSPRAFLLGDERLLVVTRGESGAFAEATGIVTGVVRRLDRDELERTLDIDLGRRLGRFDRRPVVVARRVRLVR